MMVSVYWHNQQIHDSVTSMQQELGWQTIQDRRNDPKLIIFFKIIQGLVAVPLPSQNYPGFSGCAPTIIYRETHQIHSSHAPPLLQTDPYHCKLL